MNLKSVGVNGIGLFALAVSAWAGTPGLEGVARDFSGRPIRDADVWIEAKGFSKVVKTDANGHYASGAPIVGSYKVTLLVNGSVKASIVGSDARSKSTQLNFDLPTQAAPIHKHMIWVAPEIGTHIGGGSWVEVEDNKMPISKVSVHHSEKISPNALGAVTNVGPGATCHCIGGGGMMMGLAAGRTVSSLAQPH